MPRQSIAKEEVGLVEMDEEAIEYQVIALTAAGKYTREVGKSTGWDQKKVVKFLGIPENRKKVNGANQWARDEGMGNVLIQRRAISS